MKRIKILTFVVLACFVWTARSQAQHKSRIVTFDVPGSTATIPSFINPAGVIVGEFVDANGATHGFLRWPHGVITSFDAPGAGTGPGEGTQPWSINSAGSVTGWFIDITGLAHGFVRYPDGHFTTFNAPGAGVPAGVPCTPPTICNNGTQPGSINRAGAIAGQYVDTSGVFHSFVRSPHGAITVFDDAEAGTGFGQGTFIVFGDGINSYGAILGGYTDANNLSHGFVRYSDGFIVPFDPIGSVFTDPAGINDRGQIMGFYAEATGPYHGFLRSPRGEITTFDLKGAGTASGQGTEPFNINARGDFTGAYVDAGGVSHGFLRTWDGATITFDVSGAGTGSGQGTVPDCNNPADAITGYYIDASGVYHGFLRGAPKH